MRRALQSLILTAALLGMTTGCTRLRDNNPGPQTTLLPSEASNPTPGTGGGNPASGSGSPPTTPLPGGQSGTDQGGIPLAVQVISPKDGSVVNTPEVTVTGTATPGAVVTVNDDIIEVGADGSFQSKVTLDQGPNIIEIVASDDLGNEQTIDLNIDYEP